MLDIVFCKKRIKESHSFTHQSLVVLKNCIWKLKTEDELVEQLLSFDSFSKQTITFLSLHHYMIIGAVVVNGVGIGGTLTSMKHFRLHILSHIN